MSSVVLYFQLFSNMTIIAEWNSIITGLTYPMYFEVSICLHLLYFLCVVLSMETGRNSHTT